MACHMSAAVWLRRAVLFWGIGAWIAMLPSSVFATSSVTLTWNPSVSTNVVGYNIYYGPACGVYTNMISVTGSTSTNATVTGLIQGATYYFGGRGCGFTRQQKPAFERSNICSSCGLCCHVEPAADNECVDEYDDQ
jgi:hypothetical protein